MGGVIVLMALVGLGIGFALQRWLVDSPEILWRYKLLSVSLLLFGLWVVFTQPLGWGSLLYAAMLPGGIVLAYLIANDHYLRKEFKRILPPLTRSSGDAVSGHRAIIYFTHGEPPDYDPAPWLETFRELDEHRAPFIPWAFRSFFFTGLRRFYRKIGRSPHNSIHAQIFEAFQTVLTGDIERETHFYLAFLDCDPRPDEMAILAANEGAGSILLLPVFLTNSSHTQAGREMVEKLGLEKLGIRVEMASPLWESSALRSLYIHRAEAYLRDTPLEKVGVLLVGHGQPESWDVVYPGQTAQENAFRQELRRRFIAEGVEDHNVVLAWMEFRHPSPAKAALELVANGVNQLLVIPASMSASCIHSLVQIPELIARSGLSRSIVITNLGAWGNDPLLIEALVEQVRSCVRGMEAS
jgi:protoheme ferro-lyase